MEYASYNLDSNICPPDCKKCSRLVEFRDSNVLKYPTFFNGAVPSFGSREAELLVVGLAPGLKGANQTGRPFTGDYAGDTLYQSLLDNGLAKGNYDKRKDDGFELINVRITNAVRCVPPENKPEASEINNCNNYLKEEIALMKNLKTIIALGGISHKAIIKACGLRQADYKFSHAAEHKTNVNAAQITLLDSYHCSRYNINTGRLTEDMFNQVIKMAINP